MNRLNSIQKPMIALALVVVVSSSVNAAPPVSLSGLSLGASIQEVQEKYGHVMATE
jgi:hypothetical protein